MGDSSKVVNEYLTAFTAWDIDGLRTHLADEFSFVGPSSRADGRDTFLAGAGRLAPIMRGYRILRQWEDGGDVCTVYEFDLQTAAGAGSVLMCEWNTVRDGRVTGSRLLYDTGAWNALVPVPPQQ